MDLNPNVEPDLVANVFNDNFRQWLKQQPQGQFELVVFEYISCHPCLACSEEHPTKKYKTKDHTLCDQAVQNLIHTLFSHSLSPNGYILYPQAMFQKMHITFPSQDSQEVKRLRIQMATVYLWDTRSTPLQIKSQKWFQRFPLCFIWPEITMSKLTRKQYLKSLG